MVLRKYGSILLAMVLFVSCAQRDKSETKDSISVTIQPIKYFVNELSGGDFDVTVIVPSGSSPETFEPTPSDMRRLYDSKGYISIGLLDCEMVLNSAIGDDIPTLELYHNVECIASSHSHEGHNHEGDNHEGHNHECDHHEDGHQCSSTGLDPHIWMSAKEAKSISKAITSMLCKINSDSSSKYQVRYEQFITKLDSLDQYIKGRLESRDISTIVVYHPALSYLARDYSLNQVAIEHEGKEPTITTLKSVIDTVKNNNIKHILHQEQHDRRSAEVVAKEAGCEIIDFDPLLEDWYSNMEQIADNISSALTTK